MVTVRLDDRLALPATIVTRSFPVGDVHVAPQNPAWIVTTPLETGLLGLLRESTVRAAAAALHRTGVPANVVEEHVSGLLAKVEEAGFYEGRSEVDGTMALHLYLTNRCNLACEHCYKDAGKRKGDELSRQEWIRVIDDFTEVSRGRPTQVVLSGGEVLTRTDFYDLAAHVKARGHRVNVVTNGTLIRSRRTAERLARTVDFLQVSLDGASPAANDAYRGAGTFDTVITAINLFTGLDFTVNIGMVVSGRNVDDIDDHLPDLLGRLTHQRVKLNLSGLMDYGRGARCTSHGSSEAYVERIYQRAAGLGLTRHPWRLPNTKAHDCGYARSVTIDADGEAFYCPVAVPALRSGLNVRTTPLSTIVDRFEAENRRISVERIEGCGACELEYICGGGCRLENKLTRGDELRPDCSPARKDAIYGELIKLRTR